MTNARSQAGVKLRDDEKVKHIPITIMPTEKAEMLRKPAWIKIKLPRNTDKIDHIKKTLRKNNLHSVCEEASCPNLAECFNHGTATFMILGDICTRRCPFCDVAHGKPLPPSAEEPIKLAKTIAEMKLKYVVITSVDRDDLEDGGSDIWVQTVRAIRRKSPETTMETLIPDFMGKWENLQKIIDVAPEIVSHNLETVRRLTKEVRIQAKYNRSLELLRRLKEGGMKTKSGVMLGLGETEEEIIETMDDLRAVNVDILTLGQYLQPTKKHLAVAEYVHPDVFAELKEKATGAPFKVKVSCDLFVTFWNTPVMLIN